MKKILPIIYFIITITSLKAEKGLYVNNFASILGNTASEDSLLNYASSNNFTYLALYELQIVHASHDLTTVGTSAPLATFISKAKTLYGIQKIGACGENFWWFDNIISVYNSIHPNPNEQIDVYNFEFEFWNLGSVGPGQYYCTTYLQPGGYSCDTSGAFAFYMKELKSIDSLATVDSVISELYVGWFNQHQATQMKSKVDRILLHSYVTNVNTVYSYAQTRLSYLGNTPGIVDVMPIYSGEPSFLGSWLSMNAEYAVQPIYLNDFANETGSWKANINILGYQWFAYTYMPYSSPNNIEEEVNELKLYPNPVSDQLQIENENNGLMKIHIYDQMGRNTWRTESSDAVIRLDVQLLKPGIYQVYIQIEDRTFTKRIIKE